MLGVLTFIALARATAPGVLFADIAEFQFLGVVGGTAHANGYPIYVTLANLWAKLPMGEPARRVNLLSAAAAAVAVCLLSAWISRRTGSRTAGWVTGAAFALSSPIWILGTVALPYTPDAVAILSLLLALWRWEETGRDRWLVLGFFLWGLEYGLHPGATLLAPPVGVFVAAGLRDRGVNARQALGRLVWPVAAGAAGFALCLIAWTMQDARRIPHDFLHFYGWTPPNTWVPSLDTASKRLAYDLQNKEWQHAFFGLPVRMVLLRCRGLAISLPRILTPAGLLLAVAGWLYWVRARRRVAVGFAVFLAVQCLFWMTYGIPDLEKHLLPIWLIIFLLIGSGLAAAPSWILRSLDRFAAPRTTAPEGSRIARVRVRQERILLGALALMLLAPLLAARMPNLTGVVPVDRRSLSFHVAANPERADLFSLETVRAFPLNAVLFCGWSEHFLLSYRALVQLRRKDLLFPAVTHRDRAEMVRRLAADPARTLLFVDDPTSWLPDELRPLVRQGPRFWTLSAE